jgi:capsular exopolysaccharide synthesis family protein
MAREGKSVVVLDMDLRRPSLHTFFRVPNDVGLSDLIRCETCLDKAIRPTQIEGLNIVTGGTPFHDPGRIIESCNTSSLMSKLKDRYDVIVVDSAPLLVKSDALVLAPHVDGTVVVVESEKTTRRDILGVREVFSRACVEPLGYVLNSCSLNESVLHYKVHEMTPLAEPQVARPIQLEYWESDKEYAMQVLHPPGSQKNRMHKRLCDFKMKTAE